MFFFSILPHRTVCFRNPTPGVGKRRKKRMRVGIKRRGDGARARRFGDPTYGRFFLPFNV
jgi:hypothetical protein